MCIVLVSSARADSTSAWRIGGMIDAYAQHIFESTPASLFGIELAMVDLRYTTRDMRARVALHGGNYVDRNYGGSTTWATSMLHALHAAVAGVRITDELWLDVGIMPSHIGNETAISSENISYTRSLIAETTPYFETGAKVSWAVTKEWSFAVLALNGWQKINVMDADIAFGSLVVFEPSTAWKFGWSSFIGKVPVGTSYEESTRYFNDVYASYTTADLAIAAAFDIGMQQLPANFRNFQTDTLDATWWGQRSKCGIGSTLSGL